MTPITSLVDLKPIPKVAAGGLAGLGLTTILAILALAGVHNVTPTDITTVTATGAAIITGITTLIHFGAAYLKRS